MGVTARRISSIAAGMFAACALTGHSRADDPPYEVEIVGPGSDEVAELVRQVSDLVTRDKGGLPSEPVLRQRAEGDVARIADALTASGYYDAHVETKVDFAVSPPQATITVAPGDPYRIATYRVVEVPGDRPPRLPIDRMALGVGDDAVASGAVIIGAERKLVDAYAAKGYAYAKAADRQVVIDHATHRGDVLERIDPGPPVIVTAIEIAGLRDVPEHSVRPRVKLKPRDPLTSGAVDDTRKAIYDTSLFSGIQIAWPPQPPPPRPDGTVAVPVTISLIERPPRSISGGVRYSTSEGPGVTASWENRNIFGTGTYFKSSTIIAQRERTGDLTYRVPDFLQVDQALVLDLKGGEQNTYAFQRRGGSFGAILDRPLWPQWRATGGVSIDVAQETLQNLPFRESLIGVPTSLVGDTTDDLLNPTRGSRMTFSLTPYAPLAYTRDPFVELNARASRYEALDDRGMFVLAGFAGLTVIPGVTLDQIPPEKRLYAGGGGSVRGYGYQLIGPLQPDHKHPIGGRARAEFGIEGRIRITETYGLVPFIETGTVVDRDVPDLGKLLTGAGLGFRYYTPIGPLRIDLATPLRRRHKIDDLVQFYISLGQAF